jgi:hypothetical protein
MSHDSIISQRLDHNLRLENLGSLQNASFEKSDRRLNKPPFAAFDIFVSCNLPFGC